MIKYSFKKQISNDYLSVLSIVMLLVFWGMFAFGRYFGWIPRLRRNPSPIVFDQVGHVIFLSVLIIITIICLAILFFRIRKLKRLCSMGEIVNGVVIKLEAFKDRGRIYYQYSFAGNDYEKSLAIHKSKYTVGFRANDALPVVVNPNDPNESYIRSLIDKDYIDEK